MPEIEAKFLAHDPHQVERVLAHLREHHYGVRCSGRDTIIDRYFDTPDWLIFRAGWAYRHRHASGGDELTLKAIGSNRGPLFIRDEIYQSLPDTPRQPSSTALPTGPVQQRLGAIVNGSAPRELFRIRNRRTRYAVETPDDAAARIELAVDETEIRADQSDDGALEVCRFTELELELQEGSPESLEQLAHTLAEETGLLPAQLSKFERGLQNAGLEPQLASWPVRPVSRSAPMLQLAYHHLDRELNALKLQRPRAWEGLYPEGVHQMRTATRRIRSILREFKTLLPEAEAEHLNGEFRWLARVLGAVRDLDVYRADLQHYVAAIPRQDVAELAPYQRHLQQRHVQARRELLEALADDRYRALMRRFEQFLAQGPSAAALRRWGSFRICDGAALYIDAALKRVIRRGRRISADSPPELLHALRIRAKRLRYLLEYFQPFYAEALKKPIKSARLLQQILGDHQDACVASRRLRQYAGSVCRSGEDQRLLFVLGQLVNTQEQSAAVAHHRFRAGWPRFERDLSRPRLHKRLEKAG